MKYQLIHASRLLVLGLLLYLLEVALLAGPLSWAWNSFAPDVFGMQRLGYGQAFGLLSFVAVLSLAAKGVSITSNTKE